MSLLRAFDGCATQFNILTVACGLSMAPGSVWWIWAGKEKVICQTLSLNCTVFWKLQVRAAWAAFLSLTSSETELCHVIKLSAVLGRYLDFWWELLAHAWGALVGLYQHHCKTHTNELCCNYHMKTSLGWVNQQRMEIPDKHKWPTRMFIPVATMPLFPRRPAWFQAPLAAKPLTAHLCHGGATWSSAPSSPPAGPGLGRVEGPQYLQLL